MDFHSRISRAGSSSGDELTYISEITGITLKLATDDIESKLEKRRKRNFYNRLRDIIKNNEDFESRSY